MSRDIEQSNLPLKGVSRVPGLHLQTFKLRKMSKHSPKVSEIKYETKEKSHSETNAQSPEETHMEDLEKSEGKGLQESEEIYFDQPTDDEQRREPPSFTDPLFTGPFYPPVDKSSPYPDEYGFYPEWMPQFTFTQREDGMLPQFSDQVIKDLPAIFNKAIYEIPIAKERADLIIVNMLAVISGMLPNYRGLYNESWVEANLYLVNLAPFGEGKGITKLPQLLSRKIIERKLEEAMEDIDRYNCEKDALENGSPITNRHGKTISTINQLEPKRLIRHLIPGNITKSGYALLLQHNDGRGSTYLQEISTLTDANKQEHGSFSDILRNAFHHEGLELFRKTGQESISIQALFITYILSGTFGQFSKFIPSIEDGLYSRFITYLMWSTGEFDNVFDESKPKIAEYFEERAEFMNRLHAALEKRKDNPVVFKFQAHQNVQFVEYFSVVKEEMRNKVDSRMASIINRSALICYRMVMILSMMRIAEVIDIENLPDEIVASNTDFNNALEIANVLVHHSVKSFELITENETAKAGTAKADTLTQFDSAKAAEEKSSPEEIADLKSIALQLHKEGKSVRDIAKLLFGSNGSKSSISRWLNEKK